MSTSPTPHSRDSGLSGPLRAILLIVGFGLLGAAVGLVLYGSDLLAPGGAEPADDEVQIESFEVGTPRSVDPPINISAPPEPGEPAPAFLLEDLQGEEVTLAQFRGKPVILNFWATWCAPCIFEMPELQAAYDAHGESGLVVLGLNRDEDAAVVRDFLANELDVEITFPILLDEHATVGDGYGVINLPTTYFVNADGVVTGVHRGPLTLRQIEDFLEEMS